MNADKVVNITFKNKDDVTLNDAVEKEVRLTANESLRVGYRPGDDVAKFEDAVAPGLPEHWNIGGKGIDWYILLNDASDWSRLEPESTYQVSGKYFLEKDIVCDSDVIKNNSAINISGIFDGLGHTITLKGTLDLTAVQGLGHSVDLLGKLSAQAAGSNLDSSEHIYLGGPHGIRAYPQGEASGDEGVLGTLELRYHTPVKGLTLSTYLDAGHVRIAHDAGDTMTLKGWGVALTYSKPNDWFARFDYARRIGSDEFMSNEARSHQQMWFIAGKIF